MKLGIFAKTFPGSNSSEVLKQCFESGYSVAHYNMVCSGMVSMPLEISNSDCENIQSSALENNVELIAVSGTYNMIHPDPLVRKDGHNRLSVIAKAANQIGLGLVTLCTGTRSAEDQWAFHKDNDTPEAWRDLIASMEVAVSIAEDHGIDLGIEPEMDNVVSSAQKAKRLLDELGSKCLKIIFDPANLFEQTTHQDQRDIVSRGIDLLAPDLVMAHAKDRLPDGRFGTAGKGVVDFDHYLRALMSVGFDGPLVAHGLEAREAADVATFLTGKIQRAEAAQ